jgi:hypothetical protein
VRPGFEDDGERKQPIGSTFDADTLAALQAAEEAEGWSS